jgi:hypothetical protein
LSIVASSASARGVLSHQDRAALALFLDQVGCLASNSRMNLV